MWFWHIVVAFMKLLAKIVRTQTWDTQESVSVKNKKQAVINRLRLINKWNKNQVGKRTKGGSEAQNRTHKERTYKIKQPTTTHPKTQTTTEVLLRRYILCMAIQPKILQHLSCFLLKDKRDYSALLLAIKRIPTCHNMVETTPPCSLPHAITAVCRAGDGGGRIACVAILFSLPLRFSHHTAQGQPRYHRGLIDGRLHPLLLSLRREMEQWWCWTFPTEPAGSISYLHTEQPDCLVAAEKR